MLRKMAVLFLATVSFAILAAPNALAERPLMMFRTNVPMEIPGTVLRPGRYTMLNVSSIDPGGPIAIQNARGHQVGQYVIEPISRAHIANKDIVKLEKQKNAPPRLESFVPAGEKYGYKFIYTTPAVRPEGVLMAKDVGLSTIEKK